MRVPSFIEQRQLYERASLEEVLGTCRMLGLSVPDDVASFLAEYNGRAFSENAFGTTDFAGLSFFYSFKPTEEDGTSLDAHDSFDDKSPEGWLLVADCGGPQIVVDSEGQVMIWDPFTWAGSQLRPVAASLHEMVEDLRPLA